MPIILEFLYILSKCKTILQKQHEAQTANSDIPELLKEIDDITNKYQNAQDLECLIDGQCQRKDFSDQNGENSSSPECNQILPSPNEKKVIIKSSEYKTNDPKKPFHCKLCPKMFARFRNLKDHICKHTGERPFPCEWMNCEKKFTSSRYLKEHLKTHTGEKPYKCTVCYKTFSQSSSANDHMRTHTGEKPFDCKTCSQKFGQRQSLIYHTRRQHTGEKPYLCDLCSSTFSSASALKAHIRRHNGDKPYQCKTCALKFIDSSDLKRHNRTHTGEKPYKCNICYSEFSQSYNLKGHVQRVHQAKQNDNYTKDMHFPDISLQTSTSAKNNVLPIYVPASNSGIPVVLPACEI